LSARATRRHDLRYVCRMPSTDRLDRDLELGFNALDQGRLDDAAAIATKLRKSDAEHPDVLTLAAALADARGETEEAIELYQQVAQAVPDEAGPRIAIARLELHDLGDADGALETLAGAFELIDDETMLLDAIMIKAAALVARDTPADLAAARAALGELSSSVVDDPELALELASLSFDADDSPGATKWLEVAAKEPAVRADALHFLGQIRDAEDDRAGATAAWSEVLTLDAAAPQPEFSMSDDEVERIAAAALAELPEKVRDALKRVPILIDTAPTAAQVAEGVDPRILGLFDGTPLPEGGDLAPTVTAIHLFKRNLAQAAADAGELADEIRITVLHETAHYFGLDDDDLEALGLD
jgi:predicted Zn-dependent protease with MMP-like domain